MFVYSYIELFCLGILLSLQVEKLNKYNWNIQVWISDS